MEKVMYKIECQRSGITPKAFWNYCKKQAAKHGASIEDWLTYEDWSNERNNTKSTTSHHEDWGEPQTEVYCSMPYDVQYFLAKAYNFIKDKAAVKGIVAFLEALPKRF